MALQDLVDEIRDKGGQATHVAVDVASEEDVRRIAEEAVAAFGGFDTWVNNAGVSAYGTFKELPPEDFRRIMDVNFMGQVHGARAALPHMIAEGSGVLVNVDSILGLIAQPYGAAYTMSKFAIRGLGMALRQELKLAGVRGVAVATVLPAAIDTPIYAAAANHSGRAVRPPPPVYTAERVAGVIIGALRRPRREVVAGGVLGRAFALQHAVLPALTEQLLGIDVDLSLRGTADSTAGNLYVPDRDPARVTGGGQGRRRERRRTGAVLTAAGLTLATRAVITRARP